MATASNRTRNVFEVIQQITGVPWRHTINRYSDRRWRYQGPCPTGHDTHTYGFYVSEDQGHWWCFGACGAHGSAGDLYQLLSNQTMEYRPPHPAKPRPKASKAPLPGATLEQLAVAKGLNVQWLQKYLRWRDGHWYRSKAVEMPYFDEERRLVRLRYRVSVAGGDTYRWQPGTIAIPYGLWMLPAATEAGYLVIEEGETDLAALTSHGFPALGLPGGNWRPEWARYLEGIATVYLWQEPRSGRERLDRPSTGERLAAHIAADWPDLLVIKAPPEAKDPCELAQQLGTDFPARMRELMKKAEVYVPPAETQPATRLLVPRDDRLPQSPRGKVLALLRRQANLMRYSGQFTTLTQVGPDRWKGKCPICEENDNSFYVNQGEKGWWWRCYGTCATGGDILDLKRELGRVGRD